MLKNEKEVNKNLKKIKELESLPKTSISYLIDETISELRTEIIVFENIQKGIIPPHFYEPINIGKLLISLRIKNGYTEGDLAKKLNLTKKDILLAEENEYKNFYLREILNLLSLYKVKTKTKITKLSPEIIIKLMDMLLKEGLGFEETQEIIDKL